MIDSATSAAAAGASQGARESAGWSIAGPGGKLGKQEFLQMLTTQLRYQDPMNPMEGQEFAAQLAQFSSVEQLIELNAQQKAQVDANAAVLSAVNSNVALSTIGKEVEALGDQVVVPTEDKGKTTVDFAVDAGGGVATLELLDADGVVVGRRELGKLSEGRQSVELGSAAEKLKEGLYSYRVTVKNGDQEVAVEQYMKGRVDGVRYGPAGAVLTAGPMSISIGQVIRVANPSDG